MAFFQSRLKKFILTIVLGFLFAPFVPTVFYAMNLCVNSADSDKYDLRSARMEMYARWAFLDS